MKIPSISAELGIGFLALPNADVCVQRATAGCARGDQSLELNAWPLFRATQDWAFGAGLTFALFPSAEAPRIDPDDIPRSHTRQYFLAEGTARYYAISESDFELWLGPTVGLVVVSDTFASQVDRPDLVQVGPTTGVNLVTEALTVGGAVGAGFAFSPHWKLGIYARGQTWFLPDQPSTSPTLDEASLTGNVPVLDFGVSIGFSTSRY